MLPNVLYSVLSAEIDILSSRSSWRITSIARRLLSSWRSGIFLATHNFLDGLEHKRQYLTWKRCKKKARDGLVFSFTTYHTYHNSSKTYRISSPSPSCFCAEPNALRCQSVIMSSSDKCASGPGHRACETTWAKWLSFLMSSVALVPSRAGGCATLHPFTFYVFLCDNVCSIHVNLQ